VNTNFENSLAMLLKHEGGFVHNPLDTGGMTNLGVTQAVWEKYVGKPCTESDMRALTPESVAPLYKQNYWDKIHGDELPSGVDHCVFDCSVHSGVMRAIDILQACVNVPTDHIIGPQTMAAITALNPIDLIDNYTQFRLSFLKLVPTWNVFGKGWKQRVLEVSAQSKEMAGV
jgi:lysozyme family protein